jgi:uncharacterized membrane protein YbhN (UPF0104 family)
MKARVRFALRLALTLALAAVLLRVVEWRDVMRVLAGLDRAWFALMLVSVSASRVVQAWQMSILLDRAGARVPLVRVFLANSAAALWSLALPGGMFAGAAKWHDLTRATGRGATVLAAMIYNRLALTLPLLAVGALAFAVEDPLGARGLAAGGAAALGAGSLAFALLFHAPAAHVERWAARLSGFLPRRLARPFGALVAATHDFRAFRRGDHALVLGLSLLTVPLRVTTLVCAVHAAGADLPALASAWTRVVLLAAQHLPITLGGIGVREGVLIPALGIYGVPPATAVAVGLTLMVPHLGVAALGLAHLALGSRGAAVTRQPAPAPAQAKG